jgi:hypothetical protein
LYVSFVESFLAGVQSLLARAGIEVPLNALWGVFWVTASIAAVTTLIKAAPPVIKFVSAQIKAEFWKDTGKAATLVGFVLLMVAYGFYSGSQTRSFGQAAADLIREQLADIMPIAILTQFILLTGCWIIYGFIIRMPLAHLLIPLMMASGMVVLTAAILLFTVAAAALVRLDVVLAVLAFAAIAPLVYLTLVIKAATEMPDVKAALTPDQRRKIAAGLQKPPSPWRVLGVDLVSTFGAVVLLSALIAGGVLIFVLIRHQPQGLTLARMLKGELAVSSVLFLLVCLTFRSKESIGQWQIPPAIFYFIDLSLALSAAVIALSGLSTAQVTLGATPVWLVAAGPSLLVIIAIVLINILPERHEIQRWKLSLAISVVVGLLAWPVKLYLTTALLPAVDMIL